MKVDDGLLPRRANDNGKVKPSRSWLRSKPEAGLRFVKVIHVLINVKRRGIRIEGKFFEIFESSVTGFNSGLLQVWKVFRADRERNSQNLLLLLRNFPFSFFLSTFRKDRILERNVYAGRGREGEEDDSIS